MLSKKNSMVTMVADEFLENRIILQNSVAAIGFIWFFWFQKCILLYIFVQLFLVMRCIKSHVYLFRLGLTPTLSQLTFMPFFSFSDNFIQDINIFQVLIILIYTPCSTKNILNFGLDAIPP